MSRPSAPDVDIAIVGAGFAGIGMAIRLRQAGHRDFVVLERAGELGGTWRDNTYPGCACDVQSHLYSFSFAPNPNWSQLYSPQPEILAYLKGCAARYGVMPHLRFRHLVQEATWDENAGFWRLETSQGPLTARVLVAGQGPLSEPAIPKIPGLEDFAGAQFHSARWDHDFDLAGKRVAVVGTGASAIQFVPAIQPMVAQLHVFQRTPPWVLPRFDRPVTPIEQWLFQALPASQAIVRTAFYLYRELYVLGFRNPQIMALVEGAVRHHLARQVPDPVLRAKLTPDYAMGCKRILLSNDYLPALTRPNVEVVVEGIERIDRRGVVTSDGVLREVDAIIFGTGFQVTEQPFARHVRGRGGQTLAAAWGGSPVAYRGTTVSGFPNLFLLFGPNTGLGHSSVLLMLERQFDHVLDTLAAMRRRAAVAIEPTETAQADYVAELDKMMEGTVWVSAGCMSWYLDPTGRNSTLWPGLVTSFERMMARFDPSAYHFVPPPGGTGAAGAEGGDAVGAAPRPAG
ncbi:MAG: flavin-containing monooxygenase [Candidatus Sericytochromatia bacterium]